MYLCPNCLVLNNLEDFLGRLSLSNNSTEAHTAIQLFLKLNDLQIPEKLLAFKYVEEVYCMAYALKVLSSNLPPLRVEFSSGDVITHISPDIEKEPKNYSSVILIPNFCICWLI